VLALAVGSVPRSAWSLCSPLHGSLYKALSFGQVDEDAVRRLLVANRQSTGRRSSLSTPRLGALRRRVQSRTGLLPLGLQALRRPAIVAGWSYQWVSQLNFEPDSWTARSTRRASAFG